MFGLSMTRRRLPVLLVIAAMLTSCASFVSHDEYGAYRRTRLAADDREQLIALQEYAERHSDGQWIADVQASRSEREEATWAASNATREGLEWYLQVYPDGQYVEQARPRLAALQHVADTHASQAANEQALAAERRAEADAARRTWVTRAVQYWARTLVGLNRFGSSMGRVARANPDFGRAFGQPPAPVCTPEYCIKHYGQVYHIPVPGATRIDRHIDVYLRLVLTNGRLRRAEILMPNRGFSRWYEMENQTVVTDEDPEQRMQAINWALERIQPLIEELTQERIDIIPEPIPALQRHEEAADTEAAPVAPDEAAPEAQPDQPATPAERSEIDSLLEGAAGPAEPDPQTAEPETQAPAELVLPIGILSYRHGGQNVIIFGAGDDDYGEAFDGIIIERADAPE